MVCEPLEVRRVPTLDIVEAHRGGTLAGRFVIEGRGRRLAVGAGADRDFDPGIQIRRATPAREQIGLRGVAGELLLHLKEAVHRTRGIGVIGVSRICELIRAGRQMARIRSVVADAQVSGLVRLPGSAGQLSRI